MDWIMHILGALGGAAIVALAFFFAGAWFVGRDRDGSALSWMVLLGTAFFGVVTLVGLLIFA